MKYPFINIKTKVLNIVKFFIICALLSNTSNILAQRLLITDRDSVISTFEYFPEDSLIILKTINNKTQNIYCDESNSGFTFTYQKNQLTNKQSLSITQNPIGYSDLHTNYQVCPLKPGDSVLWQYDVKKIALPNNELPSNLELLFAYLNATNVTEYLSPSGCVEIKYLYKNYPKFEITVVSSFSN